MSLNKIFKSVFLFLLALAALSCSDKQEKIPAINYESKKEVLDVVKKYCNSKAAIAVGGMFDERGKQYIAYGVEYENSEEWGIKFSFVEKSGEDFNLIFETDLLEGSFKESLVDKIKLVSDQYDLLYYNSQGYFMGSGGGEVFSYLIDMEKKQVYYAHLVVESTAAIFLYISDNTESKELVNFFTLSFKKDYPGLQIVSDDIILD
ncbi:MAG: hypothetical protein LC124_08015 [Ignavibacteriales bacterium]|nr:hypothetical protein [Ignavibacterium album]MCZ2268789.1 hypothetical protein [Ignavibacteriales bacterium]HOJ08589.1 hypothetical protein [Ignavibacteriaceae bacterium]